MKDEFTIVKSIEINSSGSENVEYSLYLRRMELELNCIPERDFIRLAKFIAGYIKNMEGQTHE